MNLLYSFWGKRWEEEGRRGRRYGEGRRRREEMAEEGQKEKGEWRRKERVLLHFFCLYSFI